MSNKQKECYWDKSIDMSKATLQVDGKVVCKFDNDNQTIIVNEGFKTLREFKLEARVKDLEERIMNHSNTVEEYCSRLANKEKEYEELKRKVELMMDCADCKVDDYKQALEEIETVTKINCEEICGRKFTDCNDTSCFSVNILDIINKAKGVGE